MNAQMFDEWCGLAQTLDRVGDRWTLLIVRELLLGPRRSGELQENIPGLAPSLLADRLREMESNGLVVHRLLDGSGAYELTHDGRGLEAAVVALIDWGGRSLPSAPPREEFRPERLTLALEAALQANEDDPSLELRVAAGGTVVRVATGTARRSPRSRPPRRPTMMSTSWSAVTSGCSSRSPLGTCPSSRRRSAGSLCTAPRRNVGRYASRT